MLATRYWAVIPAAGVGRRMGSAVPKQYLPLLGQPVLAHTLRIFLEHAQIAGVVVAISAGDEYWPQLVAQLPQSKPLLVAPGGAERSASVLNALEVLGSVAAATDWVLVHDAARPCLSAEDVQLLIHTLAQDELGGLLALPVSDTLKQADASGRVAATVERSTLWRALTPQMFRFETLRTALRQATEQGLSITDEAMALEAAGYAPRLLEGRADNLKITKPEDLALAGFYLGGAERQMRIGHGFDVHAFGVGDCITLGGVRIPHTQGLVAHSDGDVLLHALCDALLGAAALGDIGQHFPDSSAEFRNIDSRILLRRTVELVSEHGWRVGNVDLTIVAQAPRLAAHIPPMRQHLAADLRVAVERVNVKATTTERLGYLGRGEGIAAHAVALLLNR